MSIGKALRTKLAATSAVTSLIGGSSAPRIYPVELPQNATFPCLRCQRVSGPRTYDLQAATGNADARMQIDCFADSQAGVEALSTQVRLALSGFRGTVDGVQIQTCFLDAERDLEEPTLRDAVKPMKRIALDFLVSYIEATS